MAERAQPDGEGFKEGSIYRKNLFKRYNFCNKYIKNKMVLDIPCGVGWGTSLLKNAKKIYGVDISKEAIGYGLKHYKKINFKKGDMTKIPFDNNKFDVLICLEGYEHINKKKQLVFLKEAKRVLKDDGKIIITCPVLNEKGESTNNPYHLNEPHENELLFYLIKQFSPISVEKINGPENKEIRFVGQKKEYYFEGMFELTKKNLRLKNKIDKILKIDTKKFERFLGDDRALPSEGRFKKNKWFKNMFIRYLFALNFVKGKKVLDSCCGLGWGSYLISDEVEKIYAYDLDGFSIRFIKKYWKNDITAQKKDLLKFDETKKFDVILAMESIEHFDKKNGEKYIKKLSKMVNKNGLVIGSSSFPKTKKAALELCEKNDSHKYMFTEKEMKKLLKKYFKDSYIINRYVFVALK